MVRNLPLSGRVLRPRTLNISVRLSAQELRYLDELVRDGLHGTSRSATAKELVLRGFREAASAGFIHPITETPEGQRCFCLYYHGEWHGPWWCEDHNPGTSNAAQLKRIGPHSI